MLVLDQGLVSLEAKGLMSGGRGKPMTYPVARLVSSAKSA